MTTALQISGFIFAVLAFAAAAWAVISVEAFRRSTHQVTFVDPLKAGGFEPLTEETKAKLTNPSKHFDNIM